MSPASADVDGESSSRAEFDENIWKDIGMDVFVSETLASVPEGDLMDRFLLTPMPSPHTRQREGLETREQHRRGPSIAPSVAASSLTAI